MNSYPYPLQNWRKADEYPNPNDLGPREWAWKFLSRNPEYQRLWDLFDSLPDFFTSNDGSSSVNNGKWKGTPWQHFRFLEGDAAWYADPPPIKGETNGKYYERTGDGRIMPFADYLIERFHFVPAPIDPQDKLGEYHQFTDQWDRDSIPPWPLWTERPETPSFINELPPSVQEFYRHSIQRWDGYIAGINNDPCKVPILFDLRYPIDRQLKEAKELLGVSLESIDEPPQKQSFPHYRPENFALYIRLLDATAEGASPDDIAAALFPTEPNGYEEDYRVTKRVRKALSRATEIRDSEYWLIPHPLPAMT